MSSVTPALGTPGSGEAGLSASDFQTSISHRSFLFILPCPTTSTKLPFALSNAIASCSSTSKRRVTCCSTITVQFGGALVPVYRLKPPVQQSLYWSGSCTTILVAAAWRGLLRSRTNGRCLILDFQCRTWEMFLTDRDRPNLQLARLIYWLQGEIRSTSLAPIHRLYLLQLPGVLNSILVISVSLVHSVQQPKNPASRPFKST